MILHEFIIVVVLLLVLPYVMKANCLSSELKYDECGVMNAYLLYQQQNQYNLTSGNMRRVVCTQILSLYCEDRDVS